ncbi:unnamed protein product [Linum trigynum]|uniref:Uncharacterized protein n=1 Tax=Linum trigynum TaxID=586398 RepID=A0AAV2GVD3_9ROSI
MKRPTKWGSEIRDFHRLQNALNCQANLGSGRRMRTSARRSSPKLLIGERVFTTSESSTRRHFLDAQGRRPNLSSSGLDVQFSVAMAAVQLQDEHED